MLQNLSENREQRSAFQFVLWGKYNSDAKTWKDIREDGRKKGGAGEGGRKEESYKGISIMDTDATIHNKVLTNKIWQYTKGWYIITCGT